MRLFILRYLKMIAKYHKNKSGLHNFWLHYTMQIHNKGALDEIYDHSRIYDAIAGNTVLMCHG